MRNDDSYNKDEALKMLIELISVPHGASYAQRQVQLKYDISTKEMWDLTDSKEYKAALKKKNDEKNQRHKKFITANRISVIDEKNFKHGFKSKKIGEYFESLVSFFAQRQRVSILKIPEGCRVIKKNGRLIPILIKSPFDFIAQMTDWTIYVKHSKKLKKLKRGWDDLLSFYSKKIFAIHYETRIN